MLVNFVFHPDPPIAVVVAVAVAVAVHRFARREKVVDFAHHEKILDRIQPVPVVEHDVVETERPVRTAILALPEAADDPRVPRGLGGPLPVLPPGGVHLRSRLERRLEAAALEIPLLGDDHALDYVALLVAVVEEHVVVVDGRVPLPHCPGGLDDAGVVARGHGPVSGAEPRGVHAVAGTQGRALRGRRRRRRGEERIDGRIADGRSSAARDDTGTDPAGPVHERDEGHARRGGDQLRPARSVVG
mmetsp:Transcript_12087/g.26180  ORF Transcript_12087/g.26180 Transcript_12087/m.26180 type:complete len:245 (+) Transcript_12087:949-1683(+)